MSLRKEVVNLSSLCLQNIAENMQSVWMKDYVVKNMEEYNFLYIEGPFNQLAGSLVQELIRILGESHKLSKGCLHLLLQPHLTQLSLRSCSGLVNAAITRLVTVRCKHLTSLDLNSCNKVPAASLAALVEGLPRLTKLCLADTQCDASVLAAVGRCCPRLVELDLSRCKKIAPSGLLPLVYDGKNSSFCCQALRVLLLLDAKLSSTPEEWTQALCFILLALPTLEQLSNLSLASALRLIYVGDFNGGGAFFGGFPSLAEVAHKRPTREGNGPGVIKLCLKKLEDLEEEDLAIAGALCPAAEEVAISLGGHRAGPWSLVQWPNLSQLTLLCPEHPERPLEEFLPMLHIKGPRLRALSLQNLLWGQEDSLTALLAMCPNLRHFQSHLTPSWPNVPPSEPDLPAWPGDPLPLPHLLTFSLLLDGEGALHAAFQHKLGGALVSILKGCPRLESLSLRGVTASLDGVLEVVYGSDEPRPLQRLASASLCGSDVTRWGASLILRSGSDVRCLDLSHCREVTRRDHHQLQEVARKQKLNVTITWL
ncbi:uncharacterized protein PAF06_019869 [Gastrophryne carolinensis]